MHKPDYCLNCQTTLQNDYQFCYKCGQPANTHQRLTMGHIVHEVMHAVTHADKGFLYLVKELCTQPGTTIRAYLSGKHKRYFNPFSFFFIVAGLFVLSNTFFKPFNPATGADKQGHTVTYPASMKSAEKRKLYDKIKQREATATNFINTRTNILLFVSTPFIAFIMFLQYRRRLNYAENLVIMGFINPFFNLLSIFFFTPLLYLAGGTAMYFPILCCMMLSHVIYMSIVYHSVLLMPNTVVGYLKSLGSALLGIAGWSVLSFIIIGGYIMYGLL